MDFTQAGKDLLVELFNAANPGLNVPSAAVTFAAPGDNEGDDAATRDTAIVMSAVGGSGYVGNLELTYQRLDIDEDVVSLGSAEFDLGSAEQVSDIVALLNARFAINLVAGEDYVDAALPEFDGVEPDEVQTFTLNIRSQSLVYKGSVEISVRAGDVDLAGREGALDGFAYELPDD